MGDAAKPILAMHCFNNIVDFVQLHKFDTDAVSVQCRTILLQVLLCGIDALGPLVKEHHVSRLEIRHACHLCAFYIGVILAFTALATHFFFFYKCRRHFKLDRRTLAKYKTNLALHELSFSQT